MKTHLENSIIKTERTGPVLFSPYKKGEAIKKTVKQKKRGYSF